MPLYRDDAIVLRTQKLGEADRIVTFLTREHGKVRGVGKGVRRTSSKFGARLEPFMGVDVQLHTGRSPRPGMGLDTVTQVETIGAYARRICEDYTLYTAGTVMLEAADRLVAQEHEPAVQQYWLLAGALRALSERHHDAGLVLDSYLLRALAVAGGRRRSRTAHAAASRARTTRSTWRRAARSAPAAVRRGPRRPHPRPLPCCPRCSRATGRPPTRRTRGTARRRAASSPPTGSTTWRERCDR
nr:hypothetical protein GCM10025730_47080 [Promicromonospora thailandica]